MKQIKLSQVNETEITTHALTDLKKLGNIRDITKEVSTRYYNCGEVTHYNLHLENDEIVRVKNESGTSLIDAVCKLADVELFRVSKKGVQEDKLLGWVIKPIQ